MHHDVLGWEAGGDGEREFACGADVQAQAFFLHPVRERAAQECLGGVDDVGFGERGAVGTAAVADLLFVQYVEGVPKRSAASVRETPLTEMSSSASGRVERGQTDSPSVLPRIRDRAWGSEGSEAGRGEGRETVMAGASSADQ